MNTQSQTPSDLIPIERAAEIIGKPQRTVDRYVQRGRLTKYRLAVPDENGSDIRFSEAEVRSLLTAVRVESKKKPDYFSPASFCSLTRTYTLVSRNTFT